MIERQPKSHPEKTPAELRVDFRDQWRGWHKGNLLVPNEGQAVKDATTQIEAYEVVVDPLDPQDRSFYVQHFGLQALAAGFEIASAISLPNVGFSTNGHPLEMITYLLKSPKE